MQRGQNTKRVVLDAAAKVVQHTGAGHLTIEGVAREAGLSKGGVLYHFPNKKALLEGMLQSLIDGIDARAHEDADREEPNILRALVRAESTQSDAERAMSRAILAAAAEDPELLAPARRYFTDVYAQLRSTAVDLDSASVVFLALQGLVFMHMLDLSPLSAAETASAQAAMDRLAAEAGA